ncbi:sporulation protein [Cellulomonas sp. JZ18]|uniref:spore germination protein GerW family protein n=1 Tax=Cellulomonas sp. JZ18 TaxID=2654191 RepID=UPI0012D3AC8D|nr:spore germination protein GerW family protein [Cellulomonas sp. JZ18]QGQ19574.1 sporulation protein [Cellulomonas sp. JZ18]
MPDRAFDPAALVRAAADTFTVRRVFGEAYEHDGVLVVPVARATGAAGTGAGGAAAGDAAGGSGDGGGGGWTTHVRPLGVFVVDRDGARWSPVVSVDRAILGGQVLVAVVASAWALAWAVRRRR